MRISGFIFKIILLGALGLGLGVLSVSCQKEKGETKPKESAAKEGAEKGKPATPAKDSEISSTSSAADEKKPKWRLELEKEKKRDPFAIITTPDVIVETGANVTELYDLDQMILQAIMLDRSGRGNHVAFIKIPSDPSGKSDRMIRVNDRLGKQNGVVKVIAKDHIIVEEAWFDPEKEKPIIHQRTMLIFDPTKAGKKRR